MKGENYQVLYASRIIITNKQYFIHEADKMTCWEIFYKMLTDAKDSTCQSGVSL